MSGRASLFSLVPWYVRHPIEAFVGYRRDGRSFLGNVWIITGWWWANRLMPERRRSPRTW